MLCLAQNGFMSNNKNVMCIENEMICLFIVNKYFY